MAQAPRPLFTVLLAASLGAGLAIPPAHAAADLRPQGTELQVNAYTVSDQLMPQVASDAAGDFVAVWTDKLRGIFSRRFSAAGQPLGGEVRVDDSAEFPGPTRAVPGNPARIAFDSVSGGFAVTYAATDGIFVQRLNALGQAVERWGLPYNSEGETLREPDAVYDATGELFVVWKAVQASRTYILMQRFDSAGRALGGASPVNQVTAGPRSRPRLAIDPWSGDVVVTWVDERETGNADIWVRRLSGDGAPRGPELRVETNNDGEALSAQPLVHGDGGFSVVWNKRVQTGPAFRIVVAAQRFDALATRLGPEVHISEEGADEEPPAAILDPRGNPLVLWPGVDQHGPDSAVLGRLFDDSWEPLGGVFQINSFVAGAQTQPAVAVDSGGRFVALWASSPPSGPTDPPRDDSGLGLFGQRFAFAGCAPGDATLCLGGGRFQLEVAWRNPSNGQTGTGHAVPLTGDTGVFWFFGEPNLELLIKVLDGRAVNGHFWIYSGALSNVEYTITATDTATGVIRTYHNAPGQLASRADTRAFPDASPAALAAAADLAPAAPAGACQAAADALCLAGGRFRVEVGFTDPRTGVAGRGQAHALTPDTGTFWFFDPANLELMVKVLDGRAINGKFWVFFGALSDVDYTVTVTDTETGAKKAYHNERGQLASRADIAAF
jgi:hypothetical protein